MGTLIGFELRKILGNKAGMVACALALALVSSMAVLNLASAVTNDYASGERMEGLVAQQAFHDWADAHAGTLTDERVAQDVAALERARELRAQNEEMEHLSGEEVIATYGADFYHATYALVCDDYYDKLENALEAAVPQATSLREGARARLELDLDLGLMNVPYTQAERDYWLEKASQVAWPTEYGYAGAWENSFDYASFLGLAIVALCIALSGVFAGEYQTRTAAVVLPTRLGKRALPIAKVLAALVFATAYWWFCAAVLVGINVAVCGPDGWGLPLQIAGFSNPYAFTMGGALLRALLLGYLISLGMTALTLLLSARLRSTMPVAVIPMAVVFLGMFAMFITPLVKLAVLTPLSGMDWSFRNMVSYAVGPVVMDLPTVLAILYVAMLVVLTPLAMRAFRKHQVA